MIDDDELDDLDEDAPVDVLAGPGFEHTRHITTLARTKLLQWLDESVDFSWQPDEENATWSGYGPLALCSACRWPNQDGPKLIDVGALAHPLRLRVRRAFDTCYACQKTLVRPSDRPDVIREYIHESIETMKAAPLSPAEVLLGIHFLNWFAQAETYETTLAHGLGDEQHGLALDYAAAVICCSAQKQLI